MSNMTHCRFENTLLALRDRLIALEDMHSRESLSRSEREAAEEMHMASEAYIKEMGRIDEEMDQLWRVRVNETGRKGPSPTSL